MKDNPDVQIYKIQAAVLRKKSGPLKIESLEMEGPRDEEILVRLVASAPSEGAATKLLTELRAGLEGHGADLLGPAPLFRLRGRHRAQLTAKTAEPRRLAARAAQLLAAAAPAMRRAGLTAVVDVDPQSL